MDYKLLKAKKAAGYWELILAKEDEAPEDVIATIEKQNHLLYIEYARYHYDRNLELVDALLAKPRKDKLLEDERRVAFGPVVLSPENDGCPF